MTSYKKEENEFTRNPLGGRPGESHGLHRSKGGNVGGGGEVLEAFPQDNVTGVKLEDCMIDDQPMKGGVTNLEHSLKGASAVQRQAGKVERSGL